MIRASAALGVCSTASTRSLRWISSRSRAPGDGPCCCAMPAPPQFLRRPLLCGRRDAVSTTLPIEFEFTEIYGDFAPVNPLDVECSTYASSCKTRLTRGGDRRPTVEPQRAQHGNKGQTHATA